MPDHQALSTAAAGLKIGVETLLDFRRKGWITVVEKNGALFISGHQRYRAKYLLHLRQARHLSDDQIQAVMAEQRPPYSAAQVDEILKRHGFTRGHSEKDA